MPVTISGSSGIDKVNGAVITSANIVDGAIQSGDLAQKLTLGTAIATTSGTAHDFTGIPSWANRITLLVKGVSTNGTSSLILRVGSGSISSTGYSGQASSAYGYVVDATGYPLVASVATAAWTGLIILVRMVDHTWVSSGSFNITDANNGGTNSVGYSPNLGGALDRIRLTTVNGTDTFDAGSINILYEG